MEKENRKVLVSVVVPCKNEVDYIESFIQSIVNQTYNKKNIEVIIVDGNSNDGTVDIIKKYVKEYKYIKLLHNKKSITPVSLNLGIKAAKGEIIIRMDVHSEYPKNYIERLVYWLNELQADNVGGKWDIVSRDNKMKSLSIAIAYGLPISVGNVQYRIGTNKPIEVDTVPFGCYRREVFDKIGFYDAENFIMNEDDEFNFRLKQAGGKIYLVPDINIKYFARETYSKLFKQYFQYGWWKPKLLRKFKKLPSIRHFVPVSFVLFLFSFIIAFFIPFYLYFYIGFISSYILSLVIFSIDAIIKRNKSFKLLPFLMWSIFIIHFSYGLGFIRGIWDFIVLNRTINKIELTR